MDVLVLLVQYSCKGGPFFCFLKVCCFRQSIVFTKLGITIKWKKVSYGIGNGFRSFSISRHQNITNCHHRGSWTSSFSSIGFWLRGHQHYILI
ncbi:unnamed protein product [Citrullus colocynthis]|uniref:Uncharacterized protein n=1 Tax=Citrullus colocynthis TaxID=252529 RepID=A0ABP0YN76_9ROSI